MADIRLLEPLITWPKNLIFGAVTGLFEGVRQAAPWGTKLGAAAGFAIGAFFPIAGISEIIGVGAFGAVNGLVAGGVVGTGVALVAGAVIGTVGGAIHGLTNSGADHHTVENRRFQERERTHAKKYDPEKDEQMYHYLDDLYDNDPNFVDTLEEERERDQAQAEQHGR